jgi:hypothetical protein
LKIKKWKLKLFVIKLGLEEQRDKKNPPSSEAKKSISQAIKPTAN